MISLNAALQIALYVLVIISCVKPLGWYMAQIYQRDQLPLHMIEHWIYRLCGVTQQSMNWKVYASSMLLLNGLGVLFVYGVLRLQCWLPFNPQHVSSIEPWLAFNTAVSYVTNTNWQAYVGETSMSYLTQMLAFTSQNFISAATGMCLLIAFIRGLIGSTQQLGNYWVDMTRSILYILLPLALGLAVILMTQGVIQTLKPNQIIQTLESTTHPLSYAQQIIPMGPVASQVAIKQLGSNGGGFFNANAAHPFENPTPLTNFMEMLAILLIPAALTYTFGTMIKDKKQGWAILVAMVVLWVPSVYTGIVVEEQGNPRVVALGVIGPNMEGKETRFGITNSVLWTVSTTASSNGSVNSMLDSYTPAGGLIPLWLMHLGEVVFGGVGSGLYGMILMIIITVFIGGLMVGRTPEYLGKKIEPFEMKMASIAVLLMPMVVLLSTALAVTLPLGQRAIFNTAAHGLSEVLYAMTSMMNNNGSAFAGLQAGNPLFLILGGFLMLIGRYWYAIPMLAIAGSLHGKRSAPNNLGTLETHTPLFIVLLLGILITLSALTFLPVLALGPIVEQLQQGVSHAS